MEVWTPAKTAERTTFLKLACQGADKISLEAENGLIGIEQITLPKQPTSVA